MQDSQRTIEGHGTIHTTHTAEAFNTVPQDPDNRLPIAEPFRTAWQDTGDVDGAGAPVQLMPTEFTSPNTEAEPHRFTQQGSGIGDTAGPSEGGLKDGFIFKVWEIT